MTFRSKVSCGFGLGVLMAAAWPAAAALTVPFTEHFAADDALWKTGGSATPTYLTAGGHAGQTGGYIRNTQLLTDSDRGQTIMRGQDTQGASGGNFAGDWIAGNVYELSFWVRQATDGGVTDPLPYGVRLARQGLTNPPTNPGNAAAVTYTAPVGLLPNVWTRASIIISPSNPDITPESSDFASVFPDLGKIQVFVGGDAAHRNHNVTLDIDTVGVRTPEPGGLMLAGVGAGLALIRRRRRGATVA